MSEFAGFNQRIRKRHPFIVEGDYEKEVLIRSIIRAFPELDINNDRIEVFHSNIYNLYAKMEEEYRAYLEFYEDLKEVDIDLPNILLSNEENRMSKRDFQGIFLFFDYERQDSFYSSDKISKMMDIFNDETDNGRLYINYPMVEACMDMDSWDDIEYLNKSIPASLSKGNQYKTEVLQKWVEYDISVYKKVFEKVKGFLKGLTMETRTRIASEITDEILFLKRDDGTYREAIYNILCKVIGKYGILEKIVNQTSYEIQSIMKRCKYFENAESYYAYLRRLFIMLVRQNMRKSFVLAGISMTNEKLSIEELATGGYMKILLRQNQESNDKECGKIYVLNTCILLIPEFKFSLIE